MGLVNREIGLLFFFMGFCGICYGTVYKVGDSVGWAVIGNMDYNKWASSKTFLVGDTLIFEYDPRLHNVLEVSRSDFHSCDPAAPISTYATGNDSISIRGPGHYYYICGFVGHCQAGQKVDIRVPRFGRPASIPIASPIQVANESAVPLPSSIGHLAPSPSSSNGHALFYYSGLFAVNLGLFLICLDFY